MDELLTVHSPGAAGAFTSSPGGRYIYAGEGGTVVAFLGDPSAPNPKDNYETPLWQVPVGKLGVTPIEMILDPGMAWTEPINTNDPYAFLIIAGGRDGLWIMDANPANYSPTGSGSHHAYRVDDSGNSNPSTQNGIKWCNDVKLLTLESKTYVLALFAGRGRSNLRIYDLDDLRNIASLGAETGNEIAPLRVVYLKSNSNVTAPSADPNASSYSFGMALDSLSTTDAFVYVAMGEHGIFRVELKSLAGFLQPPGNVEHGPWFGNGSSYQSYRPFSSTRELYGSLEYFLPNTSSNPADLVARHNPFFLDLAIDNRGPGQHRLYAAVSNLGWCSFSLDAGVPWDEDIYNTTSGAHGFPDFLQAGQPVQIGPQSRDMIRPYSDTGLLANDRQSYTRHIDIVTTEDGLGVEFSTLVASLSNRPFLYDPGRMSDGRSLTAGLNLGPIDVAAYHPSTIGKNKYVLAYDLRDVGSGNWNYAGYNLEAAIVGGWELHVPEEQPAGELHVIYGEAADLAKLDEPNLIKGTGQNLVRAWFSSWPTTPIATTHSGSVARGRYFRQGRSLQTVAPSKLDPRVLVSAHNDSGVVPDGPMIFDPVQGTIETPFKTPGWEVENPSAVVVATGNAVPAGQSDDLMYGMTMDPRGGFLGNISGTTYEYRMGAGRRNIRLFQDSADVFRDRWRVDRFSVTEDLGQNVSAVTREKEFWMTAPACKFSVSPYENELLNDRKTWSGRPYYNVMSTFEDYNAYVVQNYSQEVDSMGLMFAGINGSPQGLWALRLSVLKAGLDDPLLPADRAYVTPLQFMAGGQLSGLIKGALTTHPEYWNIDDARTASAHSDAKYFIRKSEDQSLAAVQTWYPDLFEMPVDPSQGTDTGWILAVPCGYVALSTSDQLLTTHPTWGPDDSQLVGGFRRMMVRLFDVTDPTLIETVVGVGALAPNLDSKDLPAVTIIGPDDDTAAFLARHVQIPDNTGTVRQLLLVGDLSGRVYLYDIADVLQTMATSTPPKGKHFGSFFSGSPLVTYNNQRSLSDDASNGVYGLEVRRESWMDGTLQREATYVYVGTPRIGIELVELSFNTANVPELNYLGRIQTPGNASYLYMADVAGTTHLFMGDYEGGVRIYKHPAGGQ